MKPLSKEWIKKIDDVASVMESIHSYRKKVKAETGDDAVDGCVDCPACGNQVHYQVHKNGHVWGKCLTDNCVSFMT